MDVLIGTLAFAFIIGFGISTHAPLMVGVATESAAYFADRSQAPQSGQGDWRDQASKVGDLGKSPLRRGLGKHLR